ncbi:TPA: M20 family peptidase [Candidatus Micrarchaeota archaeon]|nr:M20 family peptidase [Candidatus Micrarchaeota archaeon]
MRMLEELVAIDSSFPNEKEMGEYLARALERRGFTVRTQEVFPGRPNILAERRGKGERTLGFYGHMDTVPVQGSWEHDPFSLREEGDRLIGLGAYDMKAGIWAVLKAVENESNATIRVAFGVDEENNSAGSFRILEDGFFKGCDLILVPEINDSPVQVDGTILLGRRGRSVYDIRVRGQSCHAAHGGGVNAISEAARVVSALDSMPRTSDEILGESSQFVSMIGGEAKSLSFPEECSLVLDRHLVGDETSESILAMLREHIASLGVDAEVSLRPRDTPYLQPYSVRREHPVVQKVTELIAPAYKSVGYSAGRSVADECVLTSEAPVLCLGPVGGNPHREDEWVSKASLLRLADAYERIVKEW